VTQLTELDYETIENAVMETARGRWFLAEHKKRHSGTDTPTILDAIARLEKVMASIKLGEPDQQKSSKTTTAPFAPAAVDIPSTSLPTKAEAHQPSDENLQFFKNDEDLFAEETSSFLTQAPAVADAPKSGEAASPENSAEAETSEPARERFKIFKKSPRDDQADAARPEDESDVPDPILHPTTEEQDRIVVIRNTSGEDIDIPLADDFKNTPETEQSVPGTN